MKILIIFALISYASAIRIQCSFIHGSWGSVEASYTCQITGMDFSDDPIRVTGYDGTHLQGYSSLDVTGVNLICHGHVNLHAIPPGIQQVFPNLIAINFGDCEGLTLTGNELIEYPNLQSFAIITSLIDRVPGNLFQPTPNIKVVSFIANQISRVGEGLLDNLMRLEEAYFQRNACIDRNAGSASEIPGLIEELRTNCRDLY